MARRHPVPALGDEVVRQPGGAPQLLEGELGLGGHLVDLLLVVVVLLLQEPGDAWRAVEAVERYRRRLALEGRARAIDD
eukprot:6856950-Prymnesium_polylepis.1